jgi:hypothetical protein
MHSVRKVLSGLLLLAAACSGSDSGTNPDPKPETKPTPAALIVVGGDGQTHTISTPVASPLAVKVTAADGRPVPNVPVSWSVAEGGGSLSAASTTTDAQGEARVQWTLGPRAGQNRVTATVPNLQPVSFAGRATAFYTVLVYMAADNNLSWAGVGDIDEMESVGSSDSVQVVVQAEFSPHETRMQGCTSGCFNRPNYNTFRYRVEKGDQVQGPDRAALDIGNRDMTSAQELADFVRWGKEAYPAQKYVLLLWNHGGGYSGLIEDQTSVGSAMMSLSTLRAGLQATQTKFEVVDFDMCLMAGAETLVTLEGLARYAVFSEENEPGTGNPYDRILARLRANPTQSGADVARGFADDFVDSYAGTRNSVTKSAVDLDRLPGFLAAWNGLAVELRDNLATHRGALSAVVPGTQGYSLPYLRDLGDFLGRLRTSTSSPVLQQKIDAVAQQVNGGLVLRNRFRSSGSYRSANVDRSTGLHVLLPSGGVADALPSSGPGSLASYKALYPGLGWTSFLDQWLSVTNQARYADQGSRQLQAALVWDTAAVSRKADLDFWVLEPNGKLFIPYLGVVTPNGTFSNDSYETGSYYEVYTSKRFVEVGTYYAFAELYEDPQNHRPVATLLYRNSPSAEWTDLYAGKTYPRLTKSVSWHNDPTPTFQEAADGAYTDLVYMASWEFKPTGAAAEGAAASRSLAQSGGAGMQVARGTPTSLLDRLTPAQVERINRLLRDPEVQVRRARARSQRAAPAAQPSLGEAGARLHRAGAGGTR